MRKKWREKNTKNVENESYHYLKSLKS